jgi:hypothetical protein
MQFPFAISCRKDAVERNLFRLDRTGKLDVDKLKPEPSMSQYKPLCLRTSVVDNVIESPWNDKGKTQRVIPANIVFLLIGTRLRSGSGTRWI